MGAFTMPLPVEIDPATANSVSTLVHIGAFAVLTGGAISRYPSQVLGVTLTVLLFSAALECGQFYVPGRYFSIDDLLANGAGIAIGLAGGVFLLRRMRLPVVLWPACT